MNRVAASRVVLAPLAIALAGCLSIPGQAATECSHDSDCHGAGEVCDEGLCYGDPPTGLFAVDFSPPSDRTDLAAVERSSERLPTSGLITDFALAAPVAISGDVSYASCGASGSLDCTNTPLSGTVAISRAPKFAGGAGFRTTTRVTETGTYSLSVPSTQSDDEDYVVVVTPDDRAEGQTTPSPAEQVPPLRTTLRASGDLSEPLALGSGELLTISGVLVDDSDVALDNYRVVAVGHWQDGDPTTEVSSVAYTDDGHFTITLSAGVVGTVDVQAKSVMATGAASILHATVDPAHIKPLQIAQPPATGDPLAMTITVQGQTSGGAVQPVSGAVVIASATVPAGSGSDDDDDGTIEMTATGTTGDDGTVQLTVLDGAAFANGYQLSIVPPAGSSLAVLEQTLTRVADTMISLKPRIAISGTVVDADGNPVADVSVTARPSLRFLWTLPVDLQPFLSQIPAATTVTPSTGDFVVFVDPIVGGVAGRYDLAFAPPTGSSVPSFTESDVSVMAGSNNAMALGNVALPAAARLHGEISDPTGVAVAGCDLEVYAIASGSASELCANVPHPPVNCAVPATLEAQATADDDGIVRFTLPRP